VRFEDWTCEGGTPADPCGIPEEPNLVSGGLGRIDGGNGDSSKRDQLRGDVTIYAGNHSIKFGGDYLDGKTKKTEAFSGGQRVQRFNEYGQVYYRHRFFVRSGSDTLADKVLRGRAIETGFYLQDSWKVFSQLTVNAGLRWDQEDLRNDLDETLLKLSNEWQPRLGIVWDPLGKGNAKVYASAGRFYYSFPTLISVFGYDATTLMTTWNFDPVGTAQNPNVIGHPSAIRTEQTFSFTVDRGLEGSYQDELTVGAERLVGSSLTVGIRGIYRRLGRAVEDRCDLDESREGYSCAIVNPGSGGVYARGDFYSCTGLDYPYDNCTDDPEVYRSVFGAEPTPPARRLYRGIEVLARKSLGERLWIQTSYVYSSLRGNYDGGVMEDFGEQQTQPGITLTFDHPQAWRNGYGRLFLDRPHSFRLDASYQTRFGLTVGVEGYVQSGAPTDKLGYFCCGFLRLIRLEQKGYAGRLPTLWEASLTMGYPIHLGPVTVTLQGFLYNVFNNQIRTRQSFAYGRGQPPPGYPDTLYDPTVPPEYVNPNYGKIQERQAPRLLRGSIKISF
jgi:hypothetical protein